MVENTAGGESGPTEIDEKSKFAVPSWATKPPPGSHLDVIKNDQLVQVGIFINLFFILS